MQRAVVFDLFGTLVPAQDKRAYAQDVAAMAAVLDVDPGAFAPLWAETARARHRGDFLAIEDNLRFICRRLGRPASPEAVGKAVAVRERAVETALDPRPDAFRVLADLRGRGLRIGLLTNCSAEVPELFERSPLAPLVDAAVFSCREGTRKPDERMYRLVCSRLDVDPGDCVYVGDGANRELTAAAAVGMRAIRLAVPGETENGYRLEDDEWAGPTIRSLLDLVRRQS
jgi:putative hydrolase of the HAD superfamily